MAREASEAPLLAVLPPSTQTPPSAPPPDHDDDNTITTATTTTTTTATDDMTDSDSEASAVLSPNPPREPIADDPEKPPAAAEPEREPRPEPDPGSGPSPSPTPSPSLPLPSSADPPSSLIISKFLKGKGREWEAVTQRSKPLTLLELPVDILRLIVKEITHTNDLTSLALTSSTLYNLAIPHIYARFDIVWPDAHTSAAEGKSVDALTYGLSTLCLGSTFAKTTHRLRRQAPGGQSLSGGAISRAPKFGGADYAKFTRKFSLGNGPPDWVAEYMIAKESGKMLGTLVALAVAKMVNLETFVWDMPTGVISDIFMALASLPDHHADSLCKLERLWIRWHDNSQNATTPTAAASPAVTQQQQAAQVPLGSTLTPIGILLPANAAHPKPRATIPYAESHVEYPTFSVVPPVRSLSVLDIDELAYLDEMAVLIDESKDRLQELRVGISAKAQHKDFVQIWDGPDLQQVDLLARWPGESTIGDRRLGGVLGVITGRVYEIRRRGNLRAREKLFPGSAAQPGTDAATGPPGGVSPTASGATTLLPSDEIAEAVGEEEVTVAAPAAPASQEQAVVVEIPVMPLSPARMVEVGDLKAPRSSSPAKSHEAGESSRRKRPDGKLKLHTLELERVPLSMHVCSKAFDWTVLTSLTLLECPQHENLWKLLKRLGQPTPMCSGFGISTASSRSSTNALQYHLNIKRIHTDITSPALITFIRETLAPNTLEVLFLQDRRRGAGAPPVTIDTIFKGAIKRHRSSLRKLLLDSSLKNNSPVVTVDSTRWRHWTLTTEILLYITSGRMPKLRELAVSLHYRDWHTFLRRLPNIPQLRSLNIPNIAEYVVTNFDPKELALQIADIITLRPEIQLCYVGLSTKCFEILEAHGSESSSPTGGSSSNDAASAGFAPSNAEEGTVAEVIHMGSDAEDTTEDEDEDEDDDDDGTESDEEGTPTSQTDPDETQSEPSDGPESDDDSFVEPGSGSQARLRLREILFYDDKVAIFKARHGRL